MRQTLSSKQTVGKMLGLLMASLLSVSLWAQAGTSLFTYGDVQIKSQQAEIRALIRGTSLEIGDTIITGVNGRAQLRMDDGAIFDLKPNTEFLIEEFSFDPSTTQLAKNVKKDENKGFYRLVRGGFRAISGLIGKRNKKNYRVTTPVATIGIRGTDYTASFCDMNCGSNSAGLYLNVASGGVVLANEAGSMEFAVGESGFVANATTAPTRVSGSESTSSDTTTSSSAVVAKEAVDAEGRAVSLESGDEIEPPVITPGPEVDGVPGRVAATVAGIPSVSVGNEANIVAGTRADLNSFATSAGEFDQGSARVTNQGFDPETGLYWGRWSHGTATQTVDGVSTDIDLNSSAAHWVYTTNQVTPVLPVTGTAEFTLVGNTNPTDNLGNSGVLGSANLSADFTSQTVDADVNLSINNQNWNAEANDVALDDQAATFAGDFDTVTITNNETGAATDGSGSLDGIITGDENGEVNGAGLAYSLSDNAETTVEGAAAFEVVEKQP